MKWVGAIGLLSLFFVGCASTPQLAAIAASGATALEGKGMTVEINILSNNPTTNCTCQKCSNLLPK